MMHLGRTFSRLMLSPSRLVLRYQSTVAPALIDTFQRKHDYLRISLTERCNLRCQYCMPEEGVDLSPADDMLQFDEVIKLASLFAELGVTKIRLTGGEPLVYPQLSALIEELAAIPTITDIAMTTNGVTLARQLPKLQAAGLTQLNISLDTLDPNLFQIITRRRGHDRVLQGIDKAIELGYTPKVNVVVTKGVNDQELLGFVDWTKNKLVDVRFIELMPFDGNRWNFAKFVSYKEMLEVIESKYDLERLEDHANDTSKAWRVPGYKGQLGFITSMSNHFCGTCNRLRLTANGQLKVCLFGAAEINLRDALRSDADDTTLTEMIGQAVSKKKSQHADPSHLLALDNPSNVSMSDPRMLLDSTALVFQPPSVSAPQLHPASIISSRRPLQPFRSYSTLSHVTADGGAHMVDVSAKQDTTRLAQASGQVRVSPAAFQAIQDNRLKKGAVLQVAELAGIQASKLTSTLIPLCHNIPVTSCRLELMLQAPDTVSVVAMVKTTGKTGVEMEALTAVSVACLTVYDMIKAVDKTAVVTNIQLDAKSGGKSGVFERS
eukprot:m.72252 g.72252  ORF g.72252 m.72252 type:complete len:549 (-) comp14246_c0_seq1:44-1690(-)